MPVMRLGLIGDNIARSQSPRLHVEAGRLCGIEVTYERLIPRDLELPFGSVFERCVDQGFRGINVTYPYKEEVVARLRVPDPTTAAVGACNTVLFSDGQPEGHNTDYSGFMAAFRATFGSVSPGRVAMAGAGGVGKAVAFGLGKLQASELRIFDHDDAKARRLAASVAAAGVAMKVTVAPTIDDATQGADGLVNCTPLGMTGYSGSAIPKHLMKGAAWAFDAVYTPVETELLVDAASAGLQIMSGYELFFHQGIDAFSLFTGLEVDAAALRQALASGNLEKADP